MDNSMENLERLRSNVPPQDIELASAKRTIEILKGFAKALFKRAETAEAELAACHAERVEALAREAALRRSCGHLQM